MASVGAFSRYRWCEIHTDEAGRRYLGERPRFGFRDLPDNRLHTVREGERLWHVAQLCFAGMPLAGDLWWVIADFQPEPILDPTIELEAGAVLVVPSRRTVESLILATDRGADT